STLKRMSVVVIVSDFISDEDVFGGQEFAMLAAKHDVIAVVPQDPTEAGTHAGRGYLQVRDLESGRQVAVSLSRRTRRSYADQMQARRDALPRPVSPGARGHVFRPT